MRFRFKFALQNKCDEQQDRFGYCFDQTRVNMS